MQSSSKHGEYTWIIYITKPVIYVTSFYQFYKMFFVLPVLFLFVWIHKLVYINYR